MQDTLPEYLLPFMQCALSCRQHAFALINAGVRNVKEGHALLHPKKGSRIQYHILTPIHSIIGGTRTCIHTPGAAYAPEDLNHDTITKVLDSAQLVYFDGRLTESAIVLAKAARQQGVPVLVEAERLRPNLEVLLNEADYVCTSAHFPQVRREVHTVLLCKPPPAMLCY